MLASVLCGCTGMAGGLVLGPLFLKYGMIPQIMSSTNQYISMFACFSVTLQYIIQDELIYEYAIILGITSLICAYIGITGITNIV